MLDEDYGCMADSMCCPGSKADDMHSAPLITGTDALRGRKDDAK